MSKLLIVVNPKAGIGDSFDIRKFLHEQLPESEYELFIPPSAEALRETLSVRLERGDIRQVLIAGGDGTVMDTLPIMTQYPEIPIALLPLGTGNLLARNLGIPLEVERAFYVALHGREQPIDLGRINGHIFALNAGIGIDAEIMDKTDPGAKRRWGFWAYFAVGSRQVLSLQPSRIRIVADGKLIQTHAIGVMCSNVGSKLGAGLVVTPDTQPDDGLLDGAIFKINGLWDSVKGLLQVLLGQRGRSRRDPVQHFRARHITVEAFPPLKAQADGNVIGQTPVTIELLPQRLKLLVPQEELHSFSLPGFPRGA